MKDTPTYNKQQFINQDVSVWILYFININNEQQKKKKKYIKILLTGDIISSIYYVNLFSYIKLFIFMF